MAHAKKDGLRYLQRKIRVAKNTDSDDVMGAIAKTSTRKPQKKKQLRMVQRWGYYYYQKSHHRTSTTEVVDRTKDPSFNDILTFLVFLDQC